ncbi:LptE family protein [Chitinophaga skermanii]|nr:LptE family protein [Chitinophaga skermanii]
MAKLLGIVPVALLFGMLSGCTIKYTANGASIDPEAKTVNVHFIENRAPNNNPTLGQKLTEGLRQKILAQTKLTQTNEARADYDFKGTITGYSFSNAAVTQIDKPATARLTVTVNITFTKRIGDKKGFQQQSFTRSADFDAQKTPSEVEDGLLRTIIPQLVDDIFNRAYANW